MTEQAPLTSAAIRQRIAALEAELPALGENEVLLTGRLQAGEPVDAELHAARMASDTADRTLRHLRAMLPGAEQREREQAERARQAEHAELVARVRTALDTIRERARLDREAEQRHNGTTARLAEAVDGVYALLPWQVQSSSRWFDEGHASRQWGNDSAAIDARAAKLLDILNTPAVPRHEPTPAEIAHRQRSIAEHARRIGLRPEWLPKDKPAPPGAAPAGAYSKAIIDLTKGAAR